MSRRGPVRGKSGDKSVDGDGDVTILAFKVAAAAPVLGVSRETVYKLIGSGKLRYVRLPGGSMLIPRSAIEEYLGSAPTESNGAA